VSIVSTPCVSPLLARTLAARLRDAVAAGEQLSSFAFAEGMPAPGPELCDGEEPAAAHDFLLRVLHAVSEPLNWQILATVVARRPPALGGEAPEQPGEELAGEAPEQPGEELAGEADAQAGEAGAAAIAMDELAAALSAPRLMVAERVGALIGVGLLARDLEHDRVLCSPAGEALFDLVCELEAEIARWLSRRRRR